MTRKQNLIAILLITFFSPHVNAQDSDSQKRIKNNKDFIFRANQKTGVLLPMYIYPSDIHKNIAFNQVIELKRRFETVPFQIILNPASGPGDKTDANYTKAMDRLIGSGCVVLGYVSTRYGKKAEAELKKEMDQWLSLYPRIQGLFFDEMIYEDTDKASAYQASLNKYAKSKGFWPTVANPGADTPERYFRDEAADIIVVHEGNQPPKEDRLKGDYFGGYSDYPPHSRSVLLHSQEKLDRDALRMIRKYSRWVYSTDAPFRPNDPKAANPWDRLSKHLEELCEELSK